MQKYFKVGNPQKESKPLTVLIESKHTKAQELQLMKIKMAHPHTRQRQIISQCRKIPTLNLTPTTPLIELGGLALQNSYWEESSGRRVAQPLWYTCINALGSEVNLALDAQVRLRPGDERWLTFRRGSLRKSSCSDTSSRCSWMKLSILPSRRESPIPLAKWR